MWEVFAFHHSFGHISFFSFISVSFSRRKRQKRTKEQERVATFSPREKVPKEGLCVHSVTFGHLPTLIFGILQELHSVWNALGHRGSHTFAGVFGGFFTVIVISLLNIKSSIKFSFIPISALLFIVGSFLYFEDAVFDYGLPYAAIIAIIQFIIILISVGIGKLIQMIKSKK